MPKKLKIVIRRPKKSESAPKISRIIERKKKPKDRKYKLS